ncbi:hypothetical protein Tco_1549639 [Tanacetum coccineum]
MPSGMCYRTFFPSIIRGLQDQRTPCNNIPLSTNYPLIFIVVVFVHVVGHLRDNLRDDVLHLLRYDSSNIGVFVISGIALYSIMPPRMRTQSVSRPVAESRGGGTGERVGRGGRGRGPRRGNDERVEELNGQGNDQGVGANGDIKRVNWNVEGVNGGVGEAPDFLTIIAQQLQNLLPAILAQVGNQGNVGNQNGNVVNENVQENVKNVLVNGNRVGCSYKEFLACNPKKYDGKGGAVVLTRWIEKMESVQDMSGCSCHTPPRRKREA